MMVKQASMKLDSDKVFASFALLEDIVDNIDDFEIAIINSDLTPEHKVAINKILTAVQNCDFYGD